MRALLLGLCSLSALAAEVPENAYFLLVGPSDAQHAVCPSPVAIRKGAFRSGEFLKSVYPGEKIEAAAGRGDTYVFHAGARTVTIKVISGSELQWDEKAGKDFRGNLCRKAMYATNAASQEQLDSLIPDEEIGGKATDAKAPAAKAPKKAKR